jgi:protein Tob/BTG
MLAEVDSAVCFLVKILANTNMDSGRMDSFKEVLQNTLVNHYQNHWFPEKPFKGSGYRCIRIVNHKMDPLVALAGASIGLTEKDLLNILPREFTLWVDPNEVSYRIGEEGSIGVLYGDDADTSDSESETSRTGSPPIVITAPDDATLAQIQSQEFLQQQCRQQHYRATSPSSGSGGWGEYISNYC